MARFKAAHAAGLTNAGQPGVRQSHMVCAGFYLGGAAGGLPMSMPFIGASGCAIFSTTCLHIVSILAIICCCWNTISLMTAVMASVVAVPSEAFWERS